MPIAPLAAGSPTLGAAPVRTTCSLARLIGQPVEQDGVLLFRKGGRVHAVAARCPHAGAPVTADDGLTISCTLHRARFRLSDGRPLTGPARAPLPVYRTELQGDDVVVRQELVTAGLRGLVRRLLGRWS